MSDVRPPAFGRGRDVSHCDACAEPSFADVELSNFWESAEVRLACRN
jgi:hypothetical protein